MRFLSGKEKKSLRDILPNGYELGKKENIVESGDLLLKNDEPYLIISERNKKVIKGLIPHLKSVNSEDFKCVYVDHGAIPFLMKGADMMRPGIQIIDDGFDKGDVILVGDEKHKKILAVGEALFSSEEMRGMMNGKCVKVLHFLGDEFY